MSDPTPKIAAEPARTLIQHLLIALKRRIKGIDPGPTPTVGDGALIDQAETFLKRGDIGGVAATDFSMEVVFRISTVPDVPEEGETPGHRLRRRQNYLETREFRSETHRIPFVPVAGQVLMIDRSVLIPVDTAYFSLGDRIVVVESHVRGPRKEVEHVLSRLPKSFRERDIKPENEDEK